MTVTYNTDLDRVKMNHRDAYLSQKSFRTIVIVQTHRHTHTRHRPIDCTIWAIKCSLRSGVWAEVHKSTLDIGANHFSHNLMSRPSAATKRAISDNTATTDRIRNSTLLELTPVCWSVLDSTTENCNSLSFVMFA